MKNGFNEDDYNEINKEAKSFRKKKIKDLRKKNKPLTTEEKAFLLTWSKHYGWRW